MFIINCPCSCIQFLNRERGDCLTIFQKLLTIKPFLIHVSWINLINLYSIYIWSILYFTCEVGGYNHEQTFNYQWSGFCVAFILSETGFYFWKLESFMRKLKKQSCIFLRIVVFHYYLLPVCLSTVIKAIFSNNLIHLEIWTSIVPS